MGLTVTIREVTETSVEFYGRFTGGSSSYSGKRACNFYIDGIGYVVAQSTTSGGSSSTFYYTLTGLEPGTTYSWAARVLEYVNGTLTNTDYTANGSFTTADLSLTVNINSVEVGSITFYARATGGKSSYTDYRWLRFWIRNMEDETEDEIYEYKSASTGGTSSTWSKTVTICGGVSLRPDTLYEWSARVGEVVDGEVEWSENDNATYSGFVVIPKEVPQLWDWSATTARSRYRDILKGTTIAAETDGKGNVTEVYLSYSVWNEMCEKVYEMREYRDWSWDSTYLSYSATRMTSSDKAMSAKRLNSLLVNVDGIVDTGLSVVSRGGTVKGRHQIVIMEKCNQAIEEG